MVEKASRDINEAKSLLYRMTNTNLATILDFIRARRTGRKADLIKRIEAWLDEELKQNGPHSQNWIRVTELIHNTSAARLRRPEVQLTYDDGATSIVPDQSHHRRPNSGGTGGPHRESTNTAIRLTLPYSRSGNYGGSMNSNTNRNSYTQAHAFMQANAHTFNVNGTSTGTTVHGTKFTVNPFFSPQRDLCPPTRLNGSGSGANITLTFKLGSAEQESFKKLDYRVIIRSCTEVAPPGVSSSDPRKDHFPEALRVQINNHSKDYAEPPLKKEKKVADTPKDITEHIRLRDMNRVQLRASSRLAFHVCLQLVQYSSVETLIQNVRTMSDDEGYNAWQKILKPLVDMDDDEDLTSGPSQISLMCPVGCIRMQYPARGKNCPHIQCFDARIYISMNERRPAWMCPVCNRKVPYDDLIVDGHYKTVIAAAKADKVYVKPGERECPEELDKPKATSIPGTPEMKTDDKENIEILDDGSTGGSASPFAKPEGLERKLKRSTPVKASTPVFIDLCSDDDDDDAPIPAAVQTGAPPATGTEASTIKRDLIRT